MEVVRPTADFKPSVWGDFFLHYSPSLSMAQMSSIEQRIKELKKDVKKMFSTNDLAEKLTLVDDLYRLGIYYHFEDEIREAIRCINDHVDDDIGGLRLVALRFRLLRQEGYAVSSGVFSKFKDSEGKFKQELSYDVEGLIQLYEASMLGTNDEPILEEAMDFARGHMAEHIHGEEPHTDQIRRAFGISFHRGMRRLEARLYIPVYAKSKDCNTILLELAKLDFNHLQSIHQAEIKSFSLWDFQDVDGLPEYMRIFLNAFAGFMTEIEELLRKKGTLHHKHYIIESFKPQVRAYFQEAVWTNTGYKPTLEEYLNVLLMSAAHHMLTSVSLCLMEEDLSKDTLDWLLSVPKIVKACCIFGRLRDDIASSEFEQQRMHLDSSLQICMRDEGITKQEAVARLNEMVENAWKDINKECLNPLPSRKHLNLLVLNFTRAMEVVYYNHEDAYTNPEGHMKENIALLLVRPIED